ncbi:putative dehydrogenase [Rhodopseudomonas palustris BisB5]|uniref:Putative dehydrogenase n=1 Tax=Rhodopseudomonas palustris (strain BisB5) TaxID=316057 RepID=Q13CG6_RHOPS|nr:putative dehydrogenase [Rhodopseudomonas palustris BisB5]
MSSDPTKWRIGLVGYGEVGKNLAENRGANGLGVAAYDLKLGDEGLFRPRGARASPAVPTGVSRRTGFWRR